jgi:hypothetical protein
MAECRFVENDSASPVIAPAICGCHAGRLRLETIDPEQAFKKPPGQPMNNL